MNTTSDTTSDTMSSHGAAAGARPGHATTGTAVTAAVAPLLLASGWILTSLLPPSPLWTTVIRVLPAGLLLLALRPGWPAGVWWHRSVILGIVNFSAFFALQAVAVHHIPAGVAATIAATQTLLVPLGAVILINTPLRRSHLVYAAIGILGVALLVLRSDEPLRLAGICAAAGTAVCTTIGLLLTRRWGQPDGVHHLTATGWQMAAGGAVLLPVAMLTESVLPPTTPTMLPVMAAVMITTAAAFAVLFGALHAGLPAAALSRLMLLCPLAVTATGWLLYQHTLAPLQLLGVVLVVIPVATACRPTTTARHRAPRHARHHAGRHTGRYGDRRHGSAHPREDSPTTTSIAVIRQSADGNDHVAMVLIRLPTAA